MNRSFPSCRQILLLLAILALIPLSGRLDAAGNSMSFKVFSGTTLFSEHTTDSATFDRAGSVVTVKGFVLHTNGKYRLMRLTLRNFTGAGSYTLAVSDASWANFSRDSTCLCQTGTATITSFDSAAGRIVGSFTFRCNSFTTAGDVTPFNIKEGAFDITRGTKLKLDIVPLTDSRLKPRDSLTFTITVKRPDDTPLAGAEVRVTDSLMIRFNHSVGTTDAQGKVSYQVRAAVGTDTGSYALRFWAMKQGETTSDTVRRVVRVDTSQRFYTMSCNGLPLVEFDAGEGKVWDGVGQNAISATGTITINRLLKFEGSMRIDTAAGGEHVEATGKWFIENIPLPGGSTGPFVLADGTRIFNPRCGIFTAPLNNIVSEAATKVFGMKFSIDQFEFINGLNSSGLKMKVTFSVPGFTSFCVEDANTQFDTSKVSVGFEITNAGLRAFSFATSSLGFAPGFCIDEFTMTYSTPRDSLDIDAKIKTPIIGFGGGFGLVDGGINRLSARVDFNTPIPLGTTPFSLKGMRAAISGLRVPPFTYTIGGTLGSTANERLFEIDLDGTYEFPLKVSLAGAYRLIKTPVTNIWQVQGTATGTIDLTQSISFSGGLKAGNLGGPSFAVNGTGALALAWNPAVELTGNITGELTIPEVSTDWPYDWINALVGLPVTLAEGAIVLKNKTIKANLDMTNMPLPYRLIGRIHMALDLEKNFGDAGFIDVGEGTIPLGAARRRVDPVGAPAPTGDGRFGLPIVRTGGEKSGASTMSAESFDTLTLDGSLLRAVIRIRSNGTVPASFLLAPDGHRIEPAVADPAATYTQTADGRKGFWTIVTPTAGRWIVGVKDAAATDSIDFFGIPAERAFAIDATTTDRRMRVTWNAAGAPAGSTVDVFLDIDGTGFDGFLIGSVPESAGSFSYTLADSLPYCSYNTYAVRSATGSLARAYASSSVSNFKSILAPPTDIRALSNTFGTTELTWRKSSDPNALGYVIYVRDAAGHDSVYATPYANQESITLQIGAQQTKSIRMMSFGRNGVQGCPAAAVAIVTSVPSPGSVENATGSLSVAPNPAGGSVRIRIDLPQSATADLAVVDMLGREVATIARGMHLERGSHDLEWNAADVPSGLYRVVLHAGTRSWTETITVTH